MTGKPPGLVLFPNIDKTSYYIILSKNTLKTINSRDLLKQKLGYTKMFVKAKTILIRVYKNIWSTFLQEYA